MKRKILIAGAAFFAALFLFSGLMLCRQYADCRRNAQVFDSIANLVRKDLSHAPPSSGSAAESEAPEDEGGWMRAHGDEEHRMAVPEDERHQMTAREKYGEVYRQNSDFAGWISIEGTNIDYPVMQTVDDPNFYLSHGFDKRCSDYGVPYVQENCVPGISDNVIIYGHHMKDGSMFADLCKYESEDFYREHKTIRFDTLSGFGEYEIVAVFKTVACSGTGFAYYRFVNAVDQAAFDAFLSECKALSLYDTGIGASYGDRLITLSTCEYSCQNGRMAVVAKKLAPSSPQTPLFTQN